MSKKRSDAELLALFERRPGEAWRLFLDRYADLVFRRLQRLGFDYDGAMDRFVYVCERLAERDFRRLRAVRYLGRRGELVPWLLRVVDRLAINWAVSKQGRRRMLKPIAGLSELDQEVFRHYFWHGAMPSEIYERLRAEGRPELRLLDVLESLDRVVDELSAKKRWRLMSNLARRRRALPLGAAAEGLRSARPDPEERALRGEAARRLASALDRLSPRQRLLLQLRYEDGLSEAAVAAVLGIERRQASSGLRSARARLRRLLGAEEVSVDQG